MTTVLDDIVSNRRIQVEALRASVSRAILEDQIRELPAPRAFAEALLSRAGRRQPAVIAEFKRSSPSAGTIREPADPAAIARAYEAGGAACLSVLTESAHFRGSPGDLAAARSACGLPVLRKDFIIDEWQVYETRAMGADALLLIAAVLDDDALRDLAAAARSLDLAVVVEVHDAAELERALALPGDLIGINNRDLRRFETRLQTCLELAPRVPGDRLVIAESGISSAADAAMLREAGIYAMLVGERLMRAECPGKALRELIGNGGAEAPD